MNHKLEVISKAVAEKLEAHAEVIHNLIAAQRRGAAEQFGYAFLAGRALLQAREIVPNGNSRLPNAGFKNWVAANLPEITMRTAENWMLFAESVLSRAQLDAANSPLLLGSAEINGSAQESILRLVPEVMDGKGMMRFMRDTRLLRRPKRRRNRLGVAGIRREQSLRARRVWERVVAGIGKAEKLLSDIESADDLNHYSKAFTGASQKIRAAIRAREANQDSLQRAA